MQPLSDRFVAALAEPHTVVARVDLIRGGAVVERIESELALETRDDAIAAGRGILDGRVSISRTGGTRRTGSVTLLDPPRITAFGDRLKIWRGIRFDDGTTEYAALGVLHVTGISKAMQGGRTIVTVDGSDLSALLAKRRWTRPYVLRAGTLFTDAIAGIVEDRLPGTATRITPSTLRMQVPMMLDGANDDPWQAIQKLAAACNRDVWFDPHGTFMATLPPSRNDPVVHTIADGGNGTILTATRREDANPGPNVVIVVGTNPAGAADIHGEAWDDDPASPTWRHGPYGEQPVYIGSPLVHTHVQARELAAAELAKLTLAAVALDCTAAPHPGLEAGDRIRVVRRADALDEIVVADSIELPLGPGEMRVGAEQPIQALARTIATLGSGSKQVRRIARRQSPRSTSVEVSGEETDDIVPATPPDSSPIDPEPGVPDPAYDPPVIDPEIPPYTIPVTAIEAPMILPPDFDIRSSDWARGLEGFNLGACENGPTDTAGTTTDTVWTFTASGTGSYDVVRNVATIFTVTVGDVQADIEASIEAWFGGPGWGSISGDWDNWTWTLPGAYPNLTFSCDSAGLTGGTATATQATVGQSGHASVEFNCGIGIGMSRTEGGAKAESEGFTVTRKRLGDIDSVAAWQAEQATLRKPRIGDIDSLVTTIKPGELYVSAADGTVLRTGVVRVKQADPTKLEILNPDGTDYAGPGGVTWPFLIDGASYIGPTDPATDSGGTYLFGDGTTVNSNISGSYGGIRFVEYVGDTDGGNVQWGSDWGSLGLEVAADSAFDLNLHAGVKLNMTAGTWIHLNCDAVRIGVNTSSEIGFFGHTVAAQPDGTAMSTVADVIAGLQSLGLFG